MSADIESDLKLEIAHVLNMDMVEYSTLLITEQCRVAAELNQIVRDTPRFREAETAGKLIRLPSGDGMALVFFNDPEAPVECAMEISAATKIHPGIRLRMGIHSGPINQLLDVNDRSNVAGAGIDVAQRVMDCGDAGHILLSKRVADDLAPYARWRPHLHDLGECEIKHGRKISLVNFYTDELGNPDLPQKLKSARENSALEQKPSKLSSLAKIVALAAATLVALSLILFQFAKTKAKPPDTASQLLPDKSIAVMPFRNLSDDKLDSYFTDGVQDEILAALAKIADLRVVSPASVLFFKEGGKGNLTEIAQALRVAHVLEGSVQRAGRRVRVTAQLINARTDAQLWAEHYDRDVADVLAIQSEIAQNIVDQLRVTLSPKEQAAIQTQPTKDLTAYDLYLRAKELSRNAVDGRSEIMRERVRLLDDAVARDPAFVPALCQLVRANLSAYWFNNDHTPARLELAKKALDAAGRLQPDAGEVHLARARFYYWGSRDYAPALAELEAARGALPNDPEPIYFTSLIERRQGEWEKSIQHMEEAATMDPRNVNVFDNLAITYVALRRYADAARILEGVLVWRPKDFDLLLSHARLNLFAAGDLRRLQSVLSDTVAKFAGPEIFAAARLQLALARRDYRAAEAALSTYQSSDLRPEPSDLAYLVPRQWYDGIIALGLNDLEKARSAFLAAHERATVAVAARPADARALMVLAEIDARLGRKDDAVHEAEHAVELLPVAKDALDGPIIARRMAGVYAQVGQTTFALDQLERVARIPNATHYGSLKLDETWDPLRSESRFEKILASLAPQTDVP